MSPVERARLSELEAEVQRLRLENEFLKSSGLLRPHAGLSERCALIEAEKANYSIAWMCRMLGVARSSFMVVGWAMASHMRTSLVIDALEMARTHGHLTSGAMFHSDRGAQYTSKDFSRYCRRIRVTASLGSTGVCWDKAAAESFFASLKNECYHLHRHETRARARFAVADYIEAFYNRKRLHSSLAYRTPAEALQDHHTAPTAA